MDDGQQYKFTYCPECAARLGEQFSTTLRCMKCMTTIEEMIRIYSRPEWKPGWKLENPHRN